MKELSKSAADFQKLASNFKAIFDFAEEVGKISNLDAEVLKVNQATSAANKAHQDAVVKLNAVKAEASVIQLKAEEVLKNAQAKADAIVNGAKVQSSNLIQEANAAKAKLADKIAELNAELASVKDEVRLSKIEYQEIESRIKDVKKKLSDFVG